MLSRRTIIGNLATATVSGVALSALQVGSGLAAPKSGKSTRLGWFNRDRDPFEDAYLSATGAVAARYSDYNVLSPEGRACKARIAIPVLLYDKLPIVLFCPDNGMSGSQYDQYIGALAASGYFVIALDHKGPVPLRGTSAITAQMNIDERARRAAEARYILDTAAAATAVLGRRADLVDLANIGTVGHKGGAWIALALAGWDSGGSDGFGARFRDGRIKAAMGIFPTTADNNTRIVNANTTNVGFAMLAGHLPSLPLPAAGSGLIGLGLPTQSDTFGGLIGGASTSSRTGSRAATEPRPLAATAAASTLYFDWTLKRMTDRKRVLYELNGRHVEGLSAPLQLRKA